jgi:hypothetical protein
VKGAAVLRMTVLVAAFALSACGGGGDLPAGSIVNSPGGGPTQSPTKLVKVKVTVTIPAPSKPRGVRPDYISKNTQSLVIALSSVNGQSVSGVNPTTINTLAHSSGCKTGPSGTICSATASGSPGDDVFGVTTYANTNATGAVLSFGTVEAKISGGNGDVNISNQLSLTLDGVIASLEVALSPNDAKRGEPAKSAVALNAFDATGAEIVGPSYFASPITLAIEGDSAHAFSLHARGRSGSSLSIVKPASGITMDYDGNEQASSIAVQASVDGPSVSKTAKFTVRGKTPPPPVGTIYALNLGSNDGQGATVTVYDGTSKGNAKPERTLQLDSKLYARSIAVDASGDLYVGYFDTQLGFSLQTHGPDAGNEIAIYPPNASGNQQPEVLTSDKSTKSLLFPAYITFDTAGDLVTYGATTIDGNSGNDSVVIYAPGSKGATAPENAWAFSAPQLRYSGPTGLALDAASNFYVNGALFESPNYVYGLYTALASDSGNPAANPARTLPWDTTTGLSPGLTRNIAIDGSSEILIANVLEELNKSSYPECQGRVSVFAAGAGGGSTDVKPLRVLTLDTVFTANPACGSYSNPLTPFFSTIALLGSSLFAADDFNNAIDMFPANGNGTVKPLMTISGSATGLNAPIGLVITSQNSGQAKARPGFPGHPR